MLVTLAEKLMMCIDTGIHAHSSFDGCLTTLPGLKSLLWIDFLPSIQQFQCTVIISTLVIFVIIIYYNFIFLLFIIVIYCNYFCIKKLCST